MYFACIFAVGLVSSYPLKLRQSMTATEGRFACKAWTSWMPTAYSNQ